MSPRVLLVAAEILGAQLNSPYDNVPRAHREGTDACSRLVLDDVSGIYAIPVPEGLLSGLDIFGSHDDFVRYAVILNRSFRI